MDFLEFLRNQVWYKPLITSSFFRFVLSVLPRRVSFRLLKRLGPVEVKIRVGKYRFWLVTSSDDDHYLEALVGGLRGWERQSLSVWAELCSKGGTVVDVGAYGGVYTVLAVAAGANHVIAYEPNPSMFSVLKATVERNEWLDRVTLRDVALSDNPGASNLVLLEGRRQTSGAHLESVPSDPNYSWGFGPKVNVSTLQAEFAVMEISEVSALKIDVEGLESEVLIGANTILSGQKATVIVESLTLASLQRVTAIMSRFGYSSGIPLDAPRPRSAREKNRFVAGNFIFRPEV